MFARNRYWNKAISAVLLLILLFIHSIKLLHAHPPVSSHDISENSFVTTINPDCSICDYQLSKDSDDPACQAFGISKHQWNDATTQLILSYTYSFHTAFENRGPPVV